MSKRKSENGEKQIRKDAADALAADIAQKAEPALARMLTNGTSTVVNSETAHRIASAMARDADKGHTRPMHEYINEARRR